MEIYEFQIDDVCFVVGSKAVLNSFLKLLSSTDTSQAREQKGKGGGG